MFRALKKLGYLAGAFCVTGLAIAPAYAATLSDHTQYTVAKDQVITGNLYASGDEVTIEGTVEGDAVVAAKKVVVTGTVEGSLLVLAQDVSISGTVEGSVRSASLTMTITGAVKSDVTAVADRLEITKEATIGDSVFFAGSNSSIQGTVPGGVHQKLGSDNTPSTSQYLYALLVTFLGIGLLGALIYSIEPHRRTRELWEETYRHFTRYFLIGLVGFFITFFVIIFLALTVIGQWVALFTLFVFCALLLVSLVDSAYFMGKLVLFRGSGSPKFTVGVFLLGLVVVLALTAAPFLGIIPFVFFLACLGSRSSYWWHSLKNNNDVF